MENQLHLVDRILSVFESGADYIGVIIEIGFQIVQRQSAALRHLLEGKSVLCSDYLGQFLEADGTILHTGDQGSHALFSVLPVLGVVLRRFGHGLHRGLIVKPCLGQVRHQLDGLTHIESHGAECGSVLGE